MELDGDFATRPPRVDVVSSRVGNYQNDPQIGLRLDQFWVR
jgi:hypothetical protein